MNIHGAECVCVCVNPVGPRSPSRRAAHTLPPTTETSKLNWDFLLRKSPRRRRRRSREKCVRI